MGVELKTIDAVADEGAFLKALNFLRMCLRAESLKKFFW